MAKVSTNISIDAEVKKQAQELFADLGLDLSTAINIFLKRAILERGFPFKIKVPNQVTIKANEDSENGNDVYGSFDSVDALTKSVET